MKLEDLRSILENTTLSKKTQELYFTNLRILMEQTNSNNLIELLENYNYVKKVINNLQATKGTKLNFYIAINSLLNKHYKNHSINTSIYKTEMNRLHDESIKKQDLNEEPKNLRNTQIKWEDIKNLEYSYRQQDYASSEHLLIALYALQPPRRNTDYLKMKIVNDIEETDDENNFLILKEKQFLINDYKTRKQHGTYITEINPMLYKIIIDNLRKNPRSYLIVKSNGQIYDTSTSYGNKLKSIFMRYLNANLGSSDLRHLYITEFLRKNPSVQARKILADQMGHNILTQLNYNIVD